MENDHVTVQQMPVYVCQNNDQGDGAPCPWYGRDRLAAVSRSQVSIGQGLFLKAVVVCECGSYLYDQGGPST